MAPFLIATLLVAATVIVHAVGFSLILRWLMRSRFGLPTTAWPIARLLMSVTWLLILIHVAEITLWALAIVIGWWGGRAGWRLSWCLRFGQPCAQGAGAA